jgi:hypothetical protein
MNNEWHMKHIGLGYPEDGGSKLLQNTGAYISLYMASYPKGLIFISIVVRI